jgi:hypothetical protein
METEIGSNFWLMAVFGGPVLLGLGLAYAGWQWRHRRKGLDQVSDRVTVQNYREEDARERRRKAS